MDARGPARTSGRKAASSCARCSTAAPRSRRAAGRGTSPCPARSRRRPAADRAGGRCDPHQHRVPADAPADRRIAPPSDPRPTTFSPTAPMPTARQTPIEPPPRRGPASTAADASRLRPAPPPARTAPRGTCDASPRSARQSPPAAAARRNSRRRAPLAPARPLRRPRAAKSGAARAAPVIRRRRRRARPRTPGVVGRSRPATLPPGASGSARPRPAVTLPPPQSRPAPLAAAQAAPGAGRRVGAFEVMARPGRRRLCSSPSRRSPPGSSPGVARRPSSSRPPPRRRRRRTSPRRRRPRPPAQPIIIEKADPSPTSTVAKDATSCRRRRRRHHPRRHRRERRSASARSPTPAPRAGRAVRPPGKPVPRVGEDPPLAANDGIGTTPSARVADHRGRRTRASTAIVTCVPTTPPPRDYRHRQRPTAPAESVGQSIDDVCKGSFFVRNVCMDQRCEEARFRSTPECIEVLARKRKRAGSVRRWAAAPGGRSSWAQVEHGRRRRRALPREVAVESGPALGYTGALFLRDRSPVPTPSDFEVPADRPHFAVWPRRLPRAVIAPETSLWFNLEVAATRFPDRAAYLFFGRAFSYRECATHAERAGRLAAGAGRRGRRPRRAVHAELPAVRGRALRHPARQRGRGAGQSDEPCRRAQALHQRPRRQGRDLQRRPGGDRRRRQRTRCPTSERAARDRRHALHRCDAGRRRSPTPTRRRRRWTPGCAPIRRCRPAARAGAKRWRRAIAARAASRARPDDLALLPYTSGTTGLPKGCMHTAPHADAQRGRRPVGLRRRPETVGLGVVPMFHITGMLYSVLGSVYTGSTVGADAALGPRARRAADLAPPHHALGLHPDDGDRPVRQPQLQELRPVEPASTSAAAARRCRTRWPAAASRSSA